MALIRNTWMKATRIGIRKESFKRGEEIEAEEMSMLSKKAENTRTGTGTRSGERLSSVQRGIIMLKVVVLTSASVSKMRKRRR